MLSSNVDSAKPFINKLENVTQNNNLTHEAIFNANGSRIYW